jgi:ABC-2 type transport system permease protein
MSWRKIWAVAMKDLAEVCGNRAAWMPMVLVPVIYIIIMPLAMILIPTSLDPSAFSLAGDPDLQAFFNNLPAEMSRSLQGLDEMQTMLMVMLGYFFAPMFLIMPLMFSTTIAAESFAGERERKTMEALLYSAATDLELFLGKVLAGVLPAILISWISFLGYTVVLNSAGFSVFHRIWFPLVSWYPLIFWLTPALAFFGIIITVLISTRVQSFMGAYQTSASTVVLVLVLLVGQATGVLYLDVAAGMLIGLGLWVVDGILLSLALKAFNRTALLAKSGS